MNLHALYNEYWQKIFALMQTYQEAETEAKRQIVKDELKKIKIEIAEKIAEVMESLSRLNVVLKFDLDLYKSTTMEHKDD